MASCPVSWNKSLFFSLFPATRRDNGRRLFRHDPAAVSFDADGHEAEPEIKGLFFACCFCLEKLLFLSCFQKDPHISRQYLVNKSR